MALPNLGAHTKGGHVAGTQDDKEDTINDQGDLIDDSENHVSILNVTAGGTFNLDTPQGNLDQYLESGLILITGTPGAPTTIILPDGDKRIAFENSSGQSTTIDTVTGATPARTLVDGTAKQFHVRGIEISIIADLGVVTGILLADGTVNPTGPFNWADQVLARAELKDYAETQIAPTAGATIELDYEDGPVFEPTIDQNTAFTFVNPPASGILGSFTLVLHQDGTGGWIPSFPGTVDWPSGIAPVPTTGPNDVNIFSFLTTDAGARWYGFVGGLDFV